MTPADLLTPLESQGVEIPGRVRRWLAVLVEDQPDSVAEWAELCGVGPATARADMAAAGLPAPIWWVALRKILTAHSELGRGQTFTCAALGCGYANPSSLYKSTARFLGIPGGWLGHMDTPTVVRRWRERAAA